jgi:hypothetical protein
MNFKMWLENKFLRLPPETDKSIDDIVDKILDNKNTSPQIGTILVNGRNIPVIRAKLPDKVTASYTHQPEIIRVNTIITLSKEKLKNTISHECIHALDTKTKMVHQKKGADNTPAYYKAPIEFDAYGSDLELFLKRFFANKQTLLKTRFQELNNFKSWLKYGKTTNAFIQKLFNYPQFTAWKTAPTLWKNFRQKLYTTLTDIERDLKHEQKEEEKKYTYRTVD